MSSNSMCEEIILCSIHWFSPQQTFKLKALILSYISIMSLFLPWTSLLIYAKKTSCIRKKRRIWRCMYRASYCNLYINQRDAQILVNSLYFFVKLLYMFRTIISPKHVEPFTEKIRTIPKNLCISLVYINKRRIVCPSFIIQLSNTSALLFRE